MADSMTLQFDRSTVSLEALQRAAYAVADAASAEITSAAEGWVCELFARDENRPGEELAHRFRTEVIDQTLRITIGNQTEQVRNLVFALAFSRTGLAGEGTGLAGNGNGNGNGEGNGDGNGEGNGDGNGNGGGNDDDDGNGDGDGR